jgi:CheY-like chemotaxis protein
MNPRRVLVMEDHPETLELLTDLLADEDYSVTATESGLGAVALARRVCPHAILLDLVLPCRSGIALLAELKAAPETATIPVVVLSGLRERLPAAQVTLAAAVLPKPFHLPILLDAVRAACGA